jgi:hypothetical protein
MIELAWGWFVIPAPDSVMAGISMSSSSGGGCLCLIDNRVERAVNVFV